MFNHYQLLIFMQGGWLTTFYNTWFFHNCLVWQANGTRDPKLYVWDVEMDIIQFFNFATGCDESDDVTRRPVSASGAGDADADRFLLMYSFCRRCCYWHSECVVSIGFKQWYCPGDICALWTKSGFKKMLKILWLFVYCGLIFSS